MGGGISTIVDLAILSHSISVEVTLTPGIYISRIHCAAFPAPSPGSGFDWNMAHTVSRIPKNGPPFTERGYVMPEITVDAAGNPVKPETEYLVKCGVDPLDGDRTPAYLHTKVKTPELPSTCETGVRINGNEAPRVLIHGQSSISLSGLEWSNFHVSMEGMHAYEVPYPIPQGSEIKLTCCPGEECEFFFALYYCEACTGSRHAGLAQTLLLDGWEAGACAPQFGANFRATAFHKNVVALEKKVELAIQVPHQEIMSVYGLEGSIAQPWCVKAHGPALPGVGCGEKCPPHAK